MQSTFFTICHVDCYVPSELSWRTMFNKFDCLHIESSQCPKCARKSSESFLSDEAPIITDIIALVA